MKKASQPFYDRIKLNKVVDPNKLYDIRNDLDEYGFTHPSRWMTAWLGC